MRSLRNARAISRRPLFSPAEGDHAAPRTETGKGQEADHSASRWPTAFQKLLVRKVIEAQEAERRWIALELHDETEQLLGSAIFRLDMCVQQCPEAAEAVKKELQKIRDILAETVNGLQSLAHGLRPSLLDDLGLEACLAWFFRTSGLKDRLHLRWRITGLKGRLPSAVDTALFRIIQEACNNARKHAQAKNLHICVRVGHSRVVAVIRDDGVGFDARALGSRRCIEEDLIPMGLTGMKERAEMLGGKLFLHSYPQEGTRVVVVIPLSPRQGGS